MIFTLALTMALAAAPAAPPAADGLGAAKELYAAAAYEDALAMLTRLSTDGSTTDATVQIDEYRSLCLYALGRTAEAESAARELLQKQPLYALESDDLSPRVEAMFTTVRKQLLPGLAKEKYRAAKEAVSAKEFTKADAQLAEVQQMIHEAERLGVKDESLADLSVLVDGFRDLAHSMIAAAAPPPAAAASANVTPAAAVPAKRAEPKTYDAGDPDVTPPVTIVQSLPPVPTALTLALRARQGVLELTIDTDGRVATAVMRQSLNNAYDSMVINAARSWKYKPAMKDGAPVRYVKAIALEFKDQDRNELQDQK